MPVVYHCPHCRKPVTVPDPMLGQVLGCPHCRGAFQTFPPQTATSPPPASQQNPFSLDDVDDEDDRPRRRRHPAGGRRQGDQGKVPLSAQLATVCAVIGSVVVTLVYRPTRPAGQGFDVKQVAIAAVVGGVCAGLGFLIGKLIEGAKADGGNTRRRRGDDDED